MLLVLGAVSVCLLYDANHKLVGNSHMAGGNDHGSWSAGWQRPDCNVEFYSSGDVTWNENGKDVARLAPGGTFTLVEDWSDHSRRMTLKQDGDKLERSYRLDGAAHPWDAEAAEWFATQLVGLDHSTGRLAAIRFRNLMAAGGTSAVFNDMRDTWGPIQGMYVRMLMDSGKLDPSGSCHVAGLASDFSYDREKADVLSDVAPQVDFASAACRDAYFASAKKINGDYDRARAVIAAANHAPASAPELTAFTVEALGVAREIAGDHEKERVLVTYAPRCTGDSARTVYLSTAKTIASDAERARALTALVREQ